MVNSGSTAAEYVARPGGYEGRKGFEVEKKVFYLDYDQALRELQDQFNDSHIMIAKAYNGFGEPIRMGVSWSAVGAVPAAKALAFAARLTAAAEAAANFKYNGYVISFEEEGKE